MEPGDVNKSVDAVAKLVRALRPIGLWYGAVTFVFCLLVYRGSAGKWRAFDDWSSWPEPLRWFTYFWVGITIFAPVYLLLWPSVAGRVQAWLADREAKAIKEARVKTKGNGA